MVPLPANVFVFAIFGFPCHIRAHEQNITNGIYLGRKRYIFSTFRCIIRSMDGKPQDRRRKLSYADRMNINRRFNNRDVSGETVEAIAADYGIHRQVASRVARAFVPLQSGEPQPAESATENEMAPDA